VGLIPLPKNFTILNRPRREVDRIEDKKYGLDVLMNFQGAWRALNSKWLEDPDSLRQGELCLISDRGEFRHFRVSIEYMKKGIAAKKPSPEEAEFELWQHKDGFSVIINAPRALAELTATFLSVVIYKDPFAIRVRKVRKKDFFLLVRHARSLGGKVTTIHLRHVKTEDMGDLSVLKISGKNIEGPNVDKLLNVAGRITRIGFQIPNLGGEEYRFWIGHWGGGTIYMPSMTEPHHAWNLIRFFEVLLESS